jgi:saccharopine dehydrogenase-like NADP-dependent oxidoreductase
MEIWQIMAQDDDTNTNTKKKRYLECEEHFRLFSYLAMTIVSIAIVIGAFIILQHLNEEEETNKSLANQETLIENQNYIKNLTQKLQTHEMEEMKELKQRTDVSLNNSKKLDQILELLKPTR